MKLHHIGCLVENLESAISEYQQLHNQTEASKIYTIQSQEVRLSFIKLDQENPTLIELVQPTNKNSFLYKLLTKKKVNFYHLGFFEKNLDSKIEELEKKGYRLVTRFKSEAFNNKECVFLYSPSLHLIELINC